MYDNITVQGIVLDTSLIKEYDKRLVLLTVEMGRITVFANGARRKNSLLTAVSQRFVMGKFVIHPGNHNTYSLVSAEIKETFIELSYDIEKLTYASYLSEVAGFFTQDGISAMDEMNLLYVSFKAILREKPSIKLVRSIFECKIMDIEGVVSEDELLRVARPKIVSDDALYVIRYILSRSIADTFSFDVSENVADEVGEIISKYLKTQCDRHFKSLDILDTLL